MSSFPLAACVLRRRLRAVALIFLLSCAVPAVRAQCPSTDNDPDAIPKIPVQKSAEEEAILPEAGFLSNTHYASQFFGFAFDLPLPVQGHQIMLPVMPEKQHALLALQYEKDNRNGYIMVTAIDPRPGFEVNTPEQQEEELKGWARSGTGFGPPPRFAVPDYLLRSGRFYYSVRHKGPNYAAQYWTSINNYVVKVVVGTNDQEFLHKAKAAMAQARFYCSQDDGTLTTKNGQLVKPEGEPYAGPTVPTYRVNAAIRDQPGKNIPLGAVNDGTYRNPDVGLQYQLPQGWDVLRPDLDSDPPLDPAALREYQFLHACSQTLLRIAPHLTGSAKAQGPRPTIVLRALDPNCLSMRTATSVRDKRVTDEVAASLEELSEFGQIGSDELVSISDHLFMVFHGTVGTSARSEDLAQRMSQAIFVTRFNKLLLVWSLIAPTSAALDEIPTSGIVFDGSPPIELRTSLRAKR